MNTQPESNEADRPLSDRKISDRALILPLIGCLLLLPPLADIFQLDLRLFGIPFTAFYLFFVWALLIVGAALLSRQIQQGSSWQQQQETRPGNRLDEID